jgi:hypothetical protein
MDSNLLQGLFTYVAALTLGFIVVPVFLKAEPWVLRDTLGLSLAFAAIGVGFMLVEIAQMQRLIFLLGHPTFSLSVVLFGLLISSGIGSFVSGRPAAARLSSLAPRRLGALLVVLALVGIVTPPGKRVSGIRHPPAYCRGPAAAGAAGFFMAWIPHRDGSRR